MTGEGCEALLATIDRGLESDIRPVRLDIPQPEIGGNRIAGTVLYVDSFGNVALNVTR